MPRFHFTRELMTPKGYARAHADADTGAEIFYGTNSAGSTFYAMGFAGKRQKPDYHHSYRNAERREKASADYLAGQRSRLTLMANLAEQRKAEGRGLELGSILRASWGYDQTNIDYYQVTALVGLSMVELRKIGRATDEATTYMAGQCTPAPDHFIGEPFRRVARAGKVKIESWGCYAYRIDRGPDGKFAASYYSTYA